ncbi:hypothetical protein MTR67_039771 [Solanum verrucosum]|uniref:Uncharacterized protein n=1 Tax=Solanum verrucosum TaxID=315347 RepID=A0AAF0UIU9_SOLVR|nr:hypothetical protein MTR67_039771 [Solanum verrucosum]
MLRQGVTNQVGQKRGAKQEVADTSRIREFLRMNPLSFTGSSTTEDLENFVEELQKGLGLTTGRRVELRKHHLRAGPVLRRPS